MSHSSVMVRGRTSCAASGRRLCVATQASFQAGSRVRVTKPTTVYHVGKFKDGLDLQDRVGVIVEDVSMYQGKELSATLPFKVEFEVADADKPVKVLAHFEEDEIEAVSSDPLEKFCEEDPSADECRVYED